MVSGFSLVEWKVCKFSSGVVEFPKKMELYNFLSYFQEYMAFDDFYAILMIYMFTPEWTYFFYIWKYFRLLWKKLELRELVEQLVVVIQGITVLPFLMGSEEEVQMEVSAEAQ